jgi:hypothetical protein
MDLTQVILGAFMTLAGLNTRLQWSWMRRKGKFRVDEDGQPMHYQRFTRISWLLVLLGVVTMATGFVT